jgi:23S rRNA (uridine2552-2'-O)-methyltransferase
MTKTWQRERKKDGYYKRAKQEGYHSRAAYKLKQINNKFKIFHRKDIVLDLGAAPGGWSQVASELIGEYGHVIGVDLVSVSAFGNVEFIVGDITDHGLSDILIEKMDNKKINVIISDAAPNISGNYSIDQAKSIFLAESALNLAIRLLAQGGNFVVKVFEGEDFKEFIDKVKDKFHSRKIFSPKASRARSSEVYVIGLGFRLKR